MRGGRLLETAAAGVAREAAQEAELAPGGGVPHEELPFPDGEGTLDRRRQLRVARTQDVPPDDEPHERVLARGRRRVRVERDDAPVGGHRAEEPRADPERRPLRETDRGPGREDEDPCSFAEPVEERVDDPSRRLASDLDVARGADDGPRRGEEEAKDVVDLRRRPHRGTGRARGRLLLDGERRQQVVDPVDVGPLHPLEELACVRRHRLDEAPLPLRIERVERERRLPRARGPGDDGDRADRDAAGDALEVVRPRAGHLDGSRGLRLHRRVRTTSWFRPARKRA